MFKSLTIKDYRGLKALGLEQLGRVNLLVGTNNCGKTSLLEAVQLLALQGDLAAFVPTMDRRGEVFETGSDTGRRDREAAVLHLFRGHEVWLGRSFTIFHSTSEHSEKLIVDIRKRAEGNSEENDSPYEDDSEAPSQGSLELVVDWVGQKTRRMEALPLSPRGGLSIRGLARRWPDPPTRPVRFLTTASLTSREVTSLFHRIVLTAEEERALEALRTIEPTLERIASVGADEEGLSSAQGGLVVKLRDHSTRVPLGSLGDGVWRLLGLALSLAAAEGGILLVDEIDTGLHHTVMDDMWRLVCATAERLDVQVFATSHSSDCWVSLARIAREVGLGNDQVTIQRLERGRPRAVAFTAEEMIVAAERGIEVR